MVEALSREPTAAPPRLAVSRPVPATVPATAPAARAALHRTDLPRALVVAAAVLAAAGLAATASWAIFGGAIDLSVYRVGGHAIVDRLPLYEQVAPHTGLPFTYTPFAAVVFGPLSVIPFPLVKVLWAALLLACLTILVVTVARQAGYGEIHRRPLVTLVVVGVAMGMEPVRHNLPLGQVNLPITLVVLLDVTGRTRRGARGIGLGLAAAVKLTPLIFVPYLLLTRRRADAARAGAAFAAATALGVLAAPADSRRYWTSLALDPSHTGSPEYVSNQSLCGLFSRLAGHPAQGMIAYRLAALALAAFGLAVAAAAARAGDDLAGATLCGVTGLLVSPISWTAHWLWVIPALALLARGPVEREWAANPRGYMTDRQCRRRAMAAVAAYAFFVAAPPWWVSHDHHREFALHGWSMLAANTYVLAGFAILAVGASRVWHRSEERHADAASIRHSARASVL